MSKLIWHERHVQHEEKLTENRTNRQTGRFMMKGNFLIERILVKLHLKKSVDYNSIEYLRSRGVTIGENVHLYNTTIDYGHGFLVTIGNNVTLTGVTVLAHDASTQIPLGVSKVGCVVIGDNVFVGQGSIILPGVHIGNNCIIGAGTVVSKNIPDHTVAAGNPVRVIESYDAFVQKHRQKAQESPVYPTLWTEKSDKEKQQMRQELANTIGYDR